MNEDEKYFFDLNGYIVVPNVLSAEDIALANEAIDRHADQIHERTGELSLSAGSKALEGVTGRGDLGGALSWPDPHGRPFRDMLVNPKIVPYLHEILGTGFRLDHNLGIITMRKGAEGHLLHGSSGPGFDRHQYYIFKDGKMHNGLTVAAYQLTDVREGDGGLCLIPGSHKGNYPCPMALRRGEAYREFIKPIICNAGDCVIFTEATTPRHPALDRRPRPPHGPLPLRTGQPRLRAPQLVRRHARPNDRRAAQGFRAALSRTAGTSCIGRVGASYLTKQSRRSSINQNSSTKSTA